MEWLKQDDLLIEKNNNQSYANKRKSITAYGNMLLYKIENVSEVSIPEDYSVDFENYKLSLFNLETLKEIISILERLRRKGIRKPVFFFANNILVFADDLTVSMTEYVIYYYYARYGCIKR